MFDFKNKRGIRRIVINFIENCLKMKSAFHNNSYQLPAYRKALEIFRISRAVAAYFSEDKNVLEMQVSSNPQHQFAGFLIDESLQLAPGIASAASAPNSASRLERIQKLKGAAKNLRQQCKNLEFSGVKELEFLRLLRQEIQQFDKMLSDWVYNSK